MAVWDEVPDDPRVQPHVERGPAGWVLVNLASRPDDVLVVGAGRRGTLGRLAFSKVGRYCLAHLDDTIREIRDGAFTTPDQNPPRPSPPEGAEPASL